MPACRPGISQPGLSATDLNSAEGPVSRILSMCGHSSRRRIAADAHQRPTRRFRRLTACDTAGPAWARSGRCATQAWLRLRFPPYLVLLRVGFTLPPALRTERCALTAPFHPYPGADAASCFRVALLRKKRGSRGGIFSVALAVRGPLRPRPGRYPAHCPAEFGLSSPGFPVSQASGSDRPVLLPGSSVPRTRCASCEGKLGKG